MVYPIEKYFKNSHLFLKYLKNKSEKYWIKRGEESVLRLFKEMAVCVPAYKKLLKEKNVDSREIKKIADIKNLPIISKDSYLKKSDLKDLCWNGDFNNTSWVISSTSGSTGEPFYFPRTNMQDLQYALTAELYLLTNFDIDKKSTLYINGFAMGVWIGGLFTYQAIKHISEKGKYKISIINPGINKTEIYNALKKFAPYFDQIIIGGYPPFIKDFVDFSITNKLKWEDYNVKFIFSAEGFSEDFRDYIAKKTHLKNYYKDTLNHYGTVDIGTKSYETPISVLIRTLALKNHKFYTELFGNNYKLPTLTQYIPEQFYFENVNNNIICSSSSGLPLFRYDLKDLGGIYSYEEMINIAKNSGIDLLKEAKKVKIYDTVWKIPFVYIYEREDFSVSFYGANIYPETIRKVLLKKEFNEFFTGKCTLEIRMTKNQDQRLFIHIENKLGQDLKTKVKIDIAESIKNNLLLENSEYRNNHKNLGNKADPHILFWPYENKKYFISKGKHKWVKK